MKGTFPFRDILSGLLHYTALFAFAQAKHYFVLGIYNHVLMQFEPYIIGWFYTRRYLCGFL